MKNICNRPVMIVKGRIVCGKRTVCMRLRPLETDPDLVATDRCMSVNENMFVVRKLAQPIMSL